MNFYHRNVFRKFELNCLRWNWRWWCNLHNKPWNMKHVQVAVLQTFTAIKNLSWRTCYQSTNFERLLNRQLQQGKLLQCIIISFWQRLSFVQTDAKAFTFLSRTQLCKAREWNLNSDPVKVSFSWNSELEAANLHSETLCNEMKSLFLFSLLECNSCKSVAMITASKKWIASRVNKRNSQLLFNRAWIWNFNLEDSFRLFIP